MEHATYTKIFLMPRVLRQIDRSPDCGAWLGRRRDDLSLMQSAPQRRTNDSDFLSYFLWFGLSLSLSAAADVRGERTAPRRVSEIPSGLRTQKHMGERARAGRHKQIRGVCRLVVNTNGAILKR